MPIVIPSGFSQVTLVHDVPGAHGEVDVVWGIADNLSQAEDLTVVMDSWQNNVVEQCFCPSVTFREGRILRGPRPGTPEYEQGANPALPIIGAQGPAMLPINNATLVTLTTGLGGVRFRGRKYLPGPPEGAVDNEGNLTVAGVAQFQSAMDVFSADCGSNGIDLVLLHGTGISATPVPTPIISMQVQRKMATQRTRLRG